MTDAAESARANSDRALRPRDAATLILIERSEPGRARVLMGKRLAGRQFIPGSSCFPAAGSSQRIGAWPRRPRSILTSRRNSTPGCAGRRRISPARWRWRRSARRRGNRACDRRARSWRASKSAARRLVQIRGDRRHSGARRHRLPRPRDHPARTSQALRRPLPDRRREFDRRAGRGGCPSRGRTGRARLDAARRSAEPRPPRHHPRGPLRSRPSARRRPRQTPPPPVLSPACGASGSWSSSSAVSRGPELAHFGPASTHGVCGFEAWGVSFAQIAAIPRRPLRSRALPRGAGRGRLSAGRLVRE